MEGIDVCGLPDDTTDAVDSKPLAQLYDVVSEVLTYEGYLTAQLMPLFLR